MSASTVVTRDDTESGLPSTRARRKRHPGRIAAQAFMITATVLWLVPMVFAFYVALRPFAETKKYGYVSLPHDLSFDNFVQAWTQSDMLRYFLNSAWITVPGVVITLFLASCVAFVVTRFSSRVNVALLIIFTAGNLLPQQVIITPLYRLFLLIHVPHFISSSGLLYNSIAGLIVINVSFQVGFCIFVLSNYFKTIPPEIYEAARVDGASVWTQYWRMAIPMSRPALAALGTLLTTWIYNDFFWAITLISTGNRRPITSALADLQGEFIANQNLIAAAALLAAVPTLVVFVVLQKQFVAGLTLGATKG